MPPKDKKKDKKKDEVSAPEAYAAHRKIRREKEEDSRVHIANKTEDTEPFGVRESDSHLAGFLNLQSESAWPSSHLMVSDDKAEGGSALHGEFVTDQESNESDIDPLDCSVPLDSLDSAVRTRSRGNSNEFVRLELLSRPNVRNLRSLWEEKSCMLPKERRDKIKSALEEDYFLSPEQTEQYFQALNTFHKKWPGHSGMEARKEQQEKSREYKLRQKWLVNFSAHVAYRLCDYIAKGQKEMLVSSRLRSIADVVLERVADILGEPKPTRMNPGRLARFMVAISDRIAVWIENAVYRADAIEPMESGRNLDQHMRLDNEKSVIC